jgi:spore coat polysaccharide biosynthesis protein SpsF
LSKCVVIVQARLSSIRLPRKILMPMGKRTMLEAIVRRCKAASIPKAVVVACPTGEDEEIFKETGIACIPGSETDVFNRLLSAAKMNQATHFVRVTADCPFVCPTLIDSMCWRATQQDQYPVIVNWQRRSWPDGFDLECYNVEWLEEYGKKHLPESEREYFAQYIIENEPHKVHNVANLTDLSLKYRLTVDWPEDLKMANVIYKEMGEEVWRGDRIVQYLQQNPKVAKMNVKRIDGRFGAKSK